MDEYLEDYKLDTTFHTDHVLHTSYKRDPKTGLKVVAEHWWFSKQEIGAGAFGSVGLQVSEKGEQRAVKTIRKALARKWGVDHNRELAALAVFSRTKVRYGSDYKFCLCIL
jgi:regulatory protein YycI of two-component signal transduction system YycFG